MPLWRFSSAIFYCIFSSIFCISGLLGNLLSIIIFSQSHFRHVSINILLLALSFADFLLLLLAIPVFVSGPMAQLFSDSNIFQKVSFFSAVYLYPLVRMFQWASVWLLVVITIERWAAVCRPFLVTQMFSCKRAIIIALSIGSLAILYNLSGFWELYLDETFNPQPRLHADEHYVFWKVTVGELLTIYILPLSITIVLTIWVSREISKTRRNTLQIASASQRSRRTESAHRTAAMLLFVVMMFLFCYCLSLVLTLVQWYTPHVFETSYGSALNDLCNLLVVLNSASTWIIYLKFSSRYRLTAKLLFIRIRNRRMYEEFVNENANKLGIYSYSVMMSQSRRYSTKTQSLIKTRPRANTLLPVESRPKMITEMSRTARSQSGPMESDGVVTQIRLMAKKSVHKSESNMLDVIKSEYGYTCLKPVRERLV